MGLKRTNSATRLRSAPAEDEDVVEQLSTVRAHEWLGARPDPARSGIRAAVAKMERELASLGKAKAADADGKVPHDALLASFDDLVHLLVLGPEPEVRECPNCGGIGMRLATICATCWTRLTPPT